MLFKKIRITKKYEKIITILNVLISNGYSLIESINGEDGEKYIQKNEDGNLLSSKIELIGSIRKQIEMVQNTIDSVIDFASSVRGIEKLETIKKLKMSKKEIDGLRIFLLSELFDATFGKKYVFKIDPSSIISVNTIFHALLENMNQE